MVTILRGGGAAVRQWLRQATDGCFARVVVLEDDPVTPVPWAGARCLLAHLRALLGDDAIDRALAPHRPRLSLVLRRLEADLDPGERAERRRFSALASASFPNTSLSLRPLGQAWKELLAPLLAGQRIALLVPDAVRLDPETRVLLRWLVHGLLDGSGPSLFVGLDPKGSSPGRFPEIDLASAREEVELLRVRDGSREVDLPLPDGIEGSASELVPSERPVDPLDDESERRGWEAIHDAAGPLLAGSASSVASADVALEAARAAFDCYGFHSALQLCVAILEQDPPREERAELHRLAALAAHNGRPPGPGSVRAAVLCRELVEEHLAAALEAEMDPDQRVHLLYRLAMANARGKQQLEAALAFADRAVDAAAARRLLSPRSAFLEAWARNARGFVRFRLGRLAEAMEDCQTAFSRLEAPIPDDEVPADEQAMTQLFLSDNLARLSHLGGDREGMRRWRARCLEIEPRVPPSKLPYLSWYRLADEDLLLAARHLDGVLEEAKSQSSPRTEALCGHLVGERYYRLGDAARALDRYRVAEAIWSRLPDAAESLPAGRLNCAVAAFRAGRLDEASRTFAGLLAGELGTDAGAATELRGALAMVAARAGDAARADALLERVMADARGLDAADVRLRAARSLAEAMLSLGRPEQARDTIAAALAEAEVAAGAGGDLPAEDRFGALLLQASLLPFDVDRACAALRLVPAAIADANAWWDLERLFRLIEPAAAGGGELERRLAADAELRAGLDRACQAGRQRPDCIGLIPGLTPGRDRLTPCGA